MRCMACGAEMVLMSVVQDDTMPVPGFEHHTFMCSECNDVERRLIFTKHGREGDIALVPERAAPSIAGEQGDTEQTVDLVEAVPSIAPVAAVVDERGVSLGLLRRVVAKVRGR
jgi:hypothetical protein